MIVRRKRNINKAINYGVKVRFLERDEFNLFLRFISRN
ncbi:peptidoglycan bridge formation glycyltransferase FemA/FemB family protein [Staphylococcus aureus]